MQRGRGPRAALREGRGSGSACPGCHACLESLCGLPSRCLESLRGLPDRCVALWRPRPRPAMVRQRPVMACRSQPDTAGRQSPTLGRAEGGVLYTVPAPGRVAALVEEPPAAKP